MSEQNFGAFIRRLRGKKALREIATGMGLNSPQTVGNWERNYQLLPEDKIPALKEVLSIPPGSENDREFDRLFKETKRKKALLSGPLLIENDQGVAPMVSGLEQLAEQARQDRDSRFILHSVSNHGFLTHDNPGLQSAVFGCAAAGVDIVFFPQPGKEEPATVKSDMKSGLENGIELYDFSLAAHKIDRNAIQKHFSLLWHKYSPPTFPLPAATTKLTAWTDRFVKNQYGKSHDKSSRAISELIQCVSVYANWLGSFLRFLVILKVDKKDDKVPAYGSLERVCPTQFEIDGIWLHFVTHSAERKAACHTWLQITDEVGTFGIVYGLELSVRRKAGLLESCLLFN